MNSLPSFETSVVPGGTYEATVIGEVKEKESSFDKTKTYLEMPFSLKSNQWGDYAKFLWAFTPRSQRFADFLLVIGGTRLPNGNVQPPRGSYVGKKCLLNIGQRTSKSEKNKIVNEVLGIFPYSEPAQPIAGEPSTEVPF